MHSETINPIEKTYRELISRDETVLKLFSGLPNEEGIIFPGEILKNVYTDYLNRQTYQPHPKGLLKARKAISNYYESHGALLNPEHILITSGTSESFFYLFQLLTRPGDNILISNPSYPLFNSIAEMTHTELRPYALQEDEGWKINFEDLQQKTDARTRAVMIVSPNNPTGSVTSVEEIEKIVAGPIKRISLNL